MAEDIQDRNKFYAVMLAAVLAGAGGNLGFGVLNDPRPDPFTGTNARVMKEEILQRSKEGDQELARRLGRLESAQQIHERSSEKWKFQIQSNTDAIKHLRGKQ